MNAITQYEGITTFFFQQYHVTEADGGWKRISDRLRGDGAELHDEGDSSTAIIDDFRIAFHYG